MIQFDEHIFQMGWFNHQLVNIEHKKKAWHRTWEFPKIGVPQNGWLIMENPIKLDDLGVPLFSETSTWSWWFGNWFSFSIECPVRFHVNLPVFLKYILQRGHSMGPNLRGKNNLHANLFGNSWGISGFPLYIILLTEEIPNNHLGCRKPCKILGCLPYELVSRISEPSTVVHEVLLGNDAWTCQ